jgi:photosystem II stability/assembly factor-like uncharacterized protein
MNTLQHFRSSALGIMGLLLLPSTLSAQVTWSVKEINPTQSSLHTSDADGASGGRVNGLGISADGNTIYAASEFGGIWKSTDRGLNWNRLNNHRPMDTWDVEVQPDDANKVYATSFYDGRVVSNSGLQVSANAGSTWIKPATFVPPAGLCDQLRIDEPTGFGIAIDPENPLHVFVGTNCGLVRSTDGGATWNFVDPTPTDLADDVWDVVVHHGGIVDVVGDDGHLRSTDGGATFTADPVAAALVGGRSSITASPDEADVLVAVIGTSLFQTTNAGTTWSPMTNPSPQGRVPFVEAAARTGDTWDLWFGDVNLHKCSCTTGAAGVRCPANTWTRMGDRFSGLHDDMGAIVFDPNAAEDACPVVVSSDGGVFRNTLTATPACLTPAWTQADKTTRALWLFGMDGSHLPGPDDEHLYLGAQDNGSFFSSNASQATVNWGIRECCDGFDDSADPDRILYSICCNAGVSRLRMRGPAMAGGGIHPSPPPGNLITFRPIDCIAQVSSTAFVVLTSSGAFFSNDVTANPTTWTELGDTPAGAVGIKSSSRSGTAEFIVQTGNGRGFSQDRLFRFQGTDAAGTWTEINRPGGTGGFGIFDVDTDDPDRLIVSHLTNNADPQMMITTDGGTTWNNLPTLDDRMTGGGIYRYRVNAGASGSGRRLPYVQPTLVAFDPQDNDVIVAGGVNAGVFFSLDGGASWRQASYPALLGRGKTPFPWPWFKLRAPQIPRPWFAYFEQPTRSISRKNHTFYVGTQGRGVWKFSVSEPSERILTLCQRFPDICLPPLMEKGKIIFNVDRLPVVIRDPIPKNCLVKYPCPGCEGVGLCPPFYHMYLYDVDPQLWDITLVSAKGKPVSYDLVPIENGVVLSFRPTKQDYIEGKIADYELLLFMDKEGGRKGKYSIRTDLKVSDHAFEPDLKDMKDLDDLELVRLPK